MSFEAKYKTKIKITDKNYMKEAIELMIHDLNLEIRNIRSFKIDSMTKNIHVKGICFKVPSAHCPADLFINKNNELELQCGEYDKQVYLSYLERIQKQFYPAVVITHKTGVPLRYDTEKQAYKLELLINR